MSNVLSEEKKKQVIALGQLGWSLRQIQKHTGVRRETAGEYLKAAGVGVRPPGNWGKKAPAKPANEVTTDPPEPKAANGVTTDSAAVFAAEVNKMKTEKMKPREQLTLEPFERDHAVVVGEYRCVDTSRLH